MKMRYILLLMVCLTIIVVSGCSDVPYEQPSKIEPTTTLETTPEVEKPTVKTFKVGESATDGRLKVSVNSIDFKDKIVFSETTTLMGEEYTTTIDSNPKAGYQFLILDLTVENLQTDMTTMISSILSFEVSDSDGYTYDFSIETFTIDRGWEDGDILPQMKKRGKVVFEVPKNPIGLKFAFKFGVMAGQTAVFEL